MQQRSTAVAPSATSISARLVHSHLPHCACRRACKVSLLLLLLQVHKLLQEHTHVRAVVGLFAAVHHAQSVSSRLTLALQCFDANVLP